MKKAIAAAAALVVLCSIAMGQEGAAPYACTFEKGTGTAVFQGVTLDAVWSAATKILMQDRFRIVSSEKPSGTLVAERRPAASSNYALTLFIEQDGTAVRVISSVGAIRNLEGLDGLVQGIGHNKASHKVEKKFYDKLAAELYE